MGLTPHLQRLQSMADSTVPDGVVAVCSNVNGAVSQLFAEERAAIECAVTKRQAEFSAGRTVARDALQQLGQAPVAIPVRPDRSPVWPRGFTGSISHCRTAVIAVAARLSEQIGCIGIDVEEADALDRELWDSICTQKELAWVQSQTDAGRWAKVIFSIKEAVYKAQYPVTERLLAFQEVEITSFDPAGRFRMRILGRRPNLVSGHFLANDEFVLAFAMAWGPVR